MFRQVYLLPVRLHFQKTALVLSAIDETLKKENSESWPAAYFAAVLALLEQAKDNSINKQTLTSAVYLLDIVSPYVPRGLLQSEFSKVILLLAPILLEPNTDAPLIRPSIGCLETLLIAQSERAWQMGADQVSPRRAIAGLLMLSLDPRPKVRKRAQEAIRKVLQNPPSSRPSPDHPAADLCGETAMKSLEEVARKSTEARRQKHLNNSNDPAMIHSLQLIRTIANATGGWPTSKIEGLCDLLLGIARAGNPHMMVVVFEIFEMIFHSMVENSSSVKLPRILSIIAELRPSVNDTQLLPPWIAIVSRAYDVAAQVEPDETFQKLPELFDLVAQFFESPAQNIRVSASECLISFLVNCVPEQVILEPSIYDEKTLEKLAQVAESLLTVKYQAAWLETFGFLGAMFDALRWRSNPMMINVVRNVGEIRSYDSFTGKKQADELIGKAIRAMGPEPVLTVLPLNLSSPSKDRPGRAWMLPLLRDYISNTNLGHFKAEFVPLSTAVFKKLEVDGNTKSMEAKIYETLFQQIWSLLPGYCDLPLDLIESFDQEFAELLATILYERPALRVDVCRALKVLVESSKAIFDIPKNEEENLLHQSRISRKEAQKYLEHLATFSGNMLAVLFNIYTQTLPQSRGPILQTINSFVAITKKQELVQTFNRVCEMLAAALQENLGERKKQDQRDLMPSTAQTLMDLVITMSAYLPRDSFPALFEIAAAIINQDNDPQLQKKAYKLIPRLSNSEIGEVALKERNAEIQVLLLTNANKVSAPARRDRLAAISALVPYIPDNSLHFIPAILSEVVIACKEHNEKARMTAFDLLIQLARRMNESKGMIQNSKVPGLPVDAPSVEANINEFLTMLSAGLAGATPHMISATITALSRVMYEFWAQTSEEILVEMVQTIDLFLTSNNREIVKSCLGFAKICVVTLPVNLMLPRLNTLIPNLMVWSHEHKGHFKAKVKHILERMIRRFGYDTVARLMPEEDQKLITNIRKTKERAKRKKVAAKLASGEGGSGEDETVGDAKFDNAYDEALYSSSGSEDEDNIKLKKEKGRKKGGISETYIVEEEDEPLDLLGRQALASISSTKPMMKAKQRQKIKAKTDLDGKLILGDEILHQKQGPPETVMTTGSAMEINSAPSVPPTGEESGVGAYVAALKNGNIARRTKAGKLKFATAAKNNKNGDEDEMDVDIDIKTTKQMPTSGEARAHGSDRTGGFKAGRGMFSREKNVRKGGKGAIAGRRGLGEDKRRGALGQGHRVMKSPKQKTR